MNNKRLEFKIPKELRYQFRLKKKKSLEKYAKAYINNLKKRIYE